MTILVKIELICKYFLIWLDLSHVTVTSMISTYIEIINSNSPFMARLVTCDCHTHLEMVRLCQISNQLILIKSQYKYFEYNMNVV